MEARAGERAVALGGGRQLKLFAFLLLHANRAVSADALIDAVWGPERDGAVKRLQVSIARLRKALEPLAADEGSALRTVSGGYLLAVGPGELDAEAFADRVEDGRRALTEGNPTRASELLGQALGLWRGPPFAEVAFEDFAQAEIRRLEELRLVALETRAEAELALGHHRELIGELESQLAEQPARERLAGQLMLALYRSGRQADALQIYQRTRTHLAQELGLEPGPALKELQSQILRQTAPLGDIGGAARDGDVDQGAGVPGASRRERVTTPPAIPTATIGRRREIDTVRELFAGERARLVTLTGPGGVGKTRVALAAAHALEPSMPDGVCWVELAGVDHAEDVPTTVSQALAITPLPGEPVLEALCRHLASKRMLLVVDNFEHLLEAALIVAELLAACPRLAVLTTSREALNLAAEHRLLICPLPLPPVSDAVSVADIESTDASACFLASARRHDPALEVTSDNAPMIARICARLEGLPLALELGAARAGALGIRELAKRLDSALGGLGKGPRDAPVRQRTLRSAIDWSYRLLDEDQARAFVHFSVFAGGATFEAAQAATGATGECLEALVAKSLITRREEPDASARLVMLETVKEYALERLADDPEQAAVRRAHLDHYLHLVERASPRLRTSEVDDAFARIDSEIENIRAALDWALDEAPATALRLVGQLHDYWWLRGAQFGALPLLEKVLEAAGPAAPAEDRARAQLTLAALIDVRGEHITAIRAIRAALELYKQAGDHAGISESYAALAAVVPSAGESDDVRALAEAACRHARLAGDDNLLGRALLTIAQTQAPEDRGAALEEGTRLLTRCGNYGWMAARYSDLGWRDLKENRVNEATEVLELALAAGERGHSPGGIMLAAGNLGWAHLFGGHFERARAAFARQLQLCRAYGFRYGAHEGLAGMAALAATDGRFEGAARLLGAGHAMGWPAPDGQPIDDRLERDYIAPARAELGPAAWTREERVGAALPFEEAIAYALEDPNTAASPFSEHAGRAKTPATATARTQQHSRTGDLQPAADDKASTRLTPA